MHLFTPRWQCVLMYKIVKKIEIAIVEKIDIEIEIEIDQKIEINRQSTSTEKIDIDPPLENTCSCKCLIVG